MDRFSDYSTATLAEGVHRAISNVAVLLLADKETNAATINALHAVQTIFDAVAERNGWPDIFEAHGTTHEDLIMGEFERLISEGFNPPA